MKELFTNIGASEKETTVFLKMLELGAQPVSVVAKHLGMPRSTVYAIIDRLKHLQLVEEFTHVGMTYIKCVPVDSLDDLIKARRRTLEQTSELLQDSLPKLHRLENKLSITPTVKFFEGKRGVMKMYEDVLKEKEFFAFFNPEIVKKKMPEYVWKVGEAVRENGRRAQEICVECPEAYKYQKHFNSPNHQVKILPRGATFQVDWIIGANVIYMISYGDSEISGTEIFSAPLAEAQQVIFSEFWKRCLD